MEGYGEVAFGPFVLGQRETKRVDLTLESPKASAPQSPASLQPQFFDEPKFTVAGVTDAMHPGGHGSDAVLRTTEALTKEAATLGVDPVNKESRDSSRPAPPSAATAKSLREAAEREPGNAELHRSLAEVEEKLGNPLEAVREYQRAAELNPSESNLFDWGAELLTHRAIEPAIEVFTKGNRLFPRSVRMLVGLGVAWYARGSYEQAAKRLCEASDLNPDAPDPYLFLGKMLSVGTTPPEGSVERLSRFVRLQPENALANYYYALSLWKQRKGPEDGDLLAQVESLLEKAVHLDPKLGAAYLQLGILYSNRKEFPKAISAYQKAIEANPGLEEAHYRLAQAYLRTGEKLKGQEELQLYDQISKRTAQETERERREIQQFVYTLQGRTSSAQPQ
jgi:tetratricopeptide (TPR) repeat protein